MYWPSIGTVKSQVVPEESRATIYNIYRVPLNAIVRSPAGVASAARSRSLLAMAPCMRTHAALFLTQQYPPARATCRLAQVLGVLLNHISTLTALSCCGVMLLLATVFQRALIARMDGSSPAPAEIDGSQGLMAGESDTDKDY